MSLGASSSRICRIEKVILHIRKAWKNAEGQCHDTGNPGMDLTNLAPGGKVHEECPLGVYHQGDNSKEESGHVS